MKHSGLSPVWLIGLALALGTTIVTLIPFSISGKDTIKSSDWIGFSGSIVGAAMTILAALIAYGAVRNQLRMDLLSREEERMEAALPGLRETAYQLRSFLNSITTALTTSALVALFDTSPVFSMETKQRRDRSAGSRVTSADQQTKRRFIAIFGLAAIAAQTKLKAENELRPYSQGNVPPSDAERLRMETANRSLELSTSEINRLTEHFRLLLLDTENKISKYEGRSLKFRAEIEAYFDC